MPDDDSRLLKRSRRGDESSFLVLYDRYRTPLFRFAWRLMRSQSGAEDVVQECFLILLKGASFDEEQGALRRYLFGIVRNLALKQVRRGHREFEEQEGAEANTDPLDRMISAERSDLVARAVAALPYPQREALILSEYEDLSLDEIATVVGVEIGAIKARLHRAREALRRRLAPQIASYQ